VVVSAWHPVGRVSEDVSDGVGQSSPGSATVSVVVVVILGGTQDGESADEGRGRVGGATAKVGRVNSGATPQRIAHNRAHDGIRDATHQGQLRGPWAHLQQCKHSAPVGSGGGPLVIVP